MNEGLWEDFHLMEICERPVKAKKFTPSPNRHKAWANLPFKIFIIQHSLKRNI